LGWMGIIAWRVRDRRSRKVGGKREGEEAFIAEIGFHRRW